MSQQTLFPLSGGSTSSPEASLVPTSRRRAEAWDSSEESGVPYGFNSSESSRLAIRLGSSLRTFLLCACEALTPSSLGWKRQGTPRGRWWWVLGRSERRTAAIAFGSSADDWPTPKATDWKDGRRGNDPRHGRQLGEDCRAMASEWATPTRRDEKGPGPKHTKGGRDLCTDVANAGGNRKSPGLDALARSGHLGEDNPNTPGSPRGSLNPDWVEALMGAPPGWTDLSEEVASELWATRTPHKSRS